MLQTSLHVSNYGPNDIGSQEEEEEEEEEEEGGGGSAQRIYGTPGASGGSAALLRWNVTAFDEKTNVSEVVCHGEVPVPVILQSPNSTMLANVPSTFLLPFNRPCMHDGSACCSIVIRTCLCVFL